MRGVRGGLILVIALAIVFMFALMGLSACVRAAPDYLDGEYRGAIRLWAYTDDVYNHVVWPAEWPDKWASEVVATCDEGSIVKVSLQYWDEDGVQYKSFIPGVNQPYSEYDFVIESGDYLFIPCYERQVLLYTEMVG